MTTFKSSLRFTCEKILKNLGTNRITCDIINAY
ncbi:hypothetical protein 7t3_0408 [Salmonella phage 7t3]|nr:hypothetical protein 7t3_0408 [Salmonella phage 7t3]